MHIGFSRGCICCAERPGMPVIDSAQLCAAGFENTMHEDRGKKESTRYDLNIRFVLPDMSELMLT